MVSHASRKVIKEGFAEYIADGSGSKRLQIRMPRVGGLPITNGSRMLHLRKSSSICLRIPDFVFDGLIGTRYSRRMLERVSGESWTLYTSPPTGKRQGTGSHGLHCPDRQVMCMHSA